MTREVVLIRFLRLQLLNVHSFCFSCIYLDREFAKNCLFDVYSYVVELTNLASVSLLSNVAMN